MGLGLWFIAMEMPLWWWWEGKASSTSFPLSMQLPSAQLVVICRHQSLALSQPRVLQEIEWSQFFQMISGPGKEWTPM